MLKDPMMAGSKDNTLDILFANEEVIALIEVLAFAKGAYKSLTDQASETGNVQHALRCGRMEQVADILLSKIITSAQIGEPTTNSKN